MKKRTTIKQMVPTTAVSVAVMILSAGCAWNVPGAGPDAQAQYAWGALEATVDYPLAATHQAARNALNDLQLVVLQEEHDHLAGQLLARDAQDETITIRLKALPDSRTRLTIRISALGDRSKSNVIFSRIMEHLRQSQ
jgi:hypothetical protein